MRDSRKQVIEDARRAGYLIEDKGSAVNVVRRHKRTNKILYGVVWYEDGVAIRADIALNATTAIRGLKNIRKALGL